VAAGGPLSYGRLSAYPQFRLGVPASVAATAAACSAVNDHIHAVAGQAAGDLCESQTMSATVVAKAGAPLYNLDARGEYT
jgi:hypothetical protein